MPQRPEQPYQPYAKNHEVLNGPNDGRPSSLQILKDNDAIGKLKGRIVLITGCSSGIGVETARYIHEAGATVFMTARDMPKLEKVIEDIVRNAEYNKDGPRPQGIEMHLDDLASVRKGAADFLQKSGGKVNMLITNAGVMASPFDTTKDGIEQQIGVNHFAHFLLFQLLKPAHLEAAKESGTNSLVITLTSAGHRFCGPKFSNKAELDAWNRGEGYQKWQAYGQSKTANIYMASSIERHYGSQGLHALSVHPGGIQTELGRHLSEEDYKLFGDPEAFKKIYKSPNQGAATTVWAAVSPHFDGKNGGRYLADVGECGPAPEGAGPAAAGYAPHIYDEEQEEQLWKLSYEALGLPKDD